MRTQTSSKLCRSCAVAAFALLAGVSVLSYFISKGDQLSQLRRSYTPPDMQDLKFGVLLAKKGTREYGLRDGLENVREIDLDALYVRSHRDGWDSAFDQWYFHNEYLWQSFDDFHIDSLPAGRQGFWDGYCAARAAIARLEADTKKK